MSKIFSSIFPAKGTEKAGPPSASGSNAPPQDSSSDTKAKGTKQNSAGEISGLSTDIKNSRNFFYVSTSLGLLIVLWKSGLSANASAPLLWALGCLASGAFVGFLFGIPKILQGDRPANNAVAVQDSPAIAIDYRQRVNTNLEEISDWLTKIIVGLGLINLKNIPPQLNRLSNILATGMDGGTINQSFALSLIIYFLVIGFLFGYLSTRLFLSRAFALADQSAIALKETKAQIESTQAQVAALETKQDLLTPTPASGNESSAATGQPSMIEASFGMPSPPPEVEEYGMALLRDLARAYLNIESPDYSVRLRLKNDAARQMHQVIVKYQISKDRLTNEAVKLENEGLALALAGYSLGSPESYDVVRLQRVAFNVQRLHIRYRIVNALGQLFEKKLVSPEARDNVMSILDFYEKDADDSLRTLIKNTRSLIQKYAP